MKLKILIALIVLGSSCAAKQAKPDAPATNSESMAAEEDDSDFGAKMDERAAEEENDAAKADKDEEGDEVPEENPE